MIAISFFLSIFLYFVLRVESNQPTAAQLSRPCLHPNYLGQTKGVTMTLVKGKGGSVEESKKILDAKPSNGNLQDRNAIFWRHGRV
jgi:hypothetical protein